MLESRSVTFANIFFHSETGESNSENWPLGAQRLHHIDSAAIGQTEVANEHIEFLLRTKIERRLNIDRRLHMIATPSKQSCERSVGIFVVLDKQNAHGLALRHLWRRGGGNLTIRFFTSGKAQGEFSAFISASAFRTDGSFVCFDKRFADGKAETQTSRLRPPSLLESIEDFRQ